MDWEEVLKDVPKPNQPNQKSDSDDEPLVIENETNSQEISFNDIVQPKPRYNSTVVPCFTSTMRKTRKTFKNA